MSFPKISVGYSNGNLLQDIAAIDGIAGLVVSVVTPALIGIPLKVFSLADAENQGIIAAAEPFAHRHIAEFYGEVGGNQLLWILGTAQTMTMASALDQTNIAGAIKLIIAADSSIRLLAISRLADAAYVPGISFLDADVPAAVGHAKTFCLAQLAALRPLRVLIEGIVANEASLDIYQPNQASAGFAGVVLGSSMADGQASIGVALGRAVKYGAEIKIGKVANGPLSISDAYIGTKNIKHVLALETLHDMGYITFMKHPQKGGIYFGIDHMATIADDRLLAYGRVLDKATVITAATYIEEIENDVDLDPVTGFMDETSIKHLEGKIRQQINAGMGNQISGLKVVINPAQDVENTSAITISLGVIPKGYTSYINVILGLSAPSVV